MDTAAACMVLSKPGARSMDTLLLLPLFISVVSAHDLIRTTWGVDRMNDPKEWKAWMVEKANAGYAGVEAPTWGVCGMPAGPTIGCGAHACDSERVNLWAEALEASGLYFIAQLHTCGYPISSGAVADHVGSVAALAETAVALNASLANVHGGCDYWSLDEKLAFLKSTAAVEVNTGLLMAHETHRMRALSTPWTTREVFDAVAAMDGGVLFAADAGSSSSSLGHLNLTADLSHWILASERLMDFPADASWWPELLDKVADAALLTHARVGSPREIQVADPAAPEVAAVVEAYEAWWNVIWARQIDKQQASGSGSVVRVEAEFGPAPYMPALPFTQADMADLDANVEYIGRRQMKRLENGECQATSTAAAP